MSPVFSRQTLRQNLGRDHVRDTRISTTTASWGSVTGAIVILDRVDANLDYSGQNLYQRSWLLVGGQEFQVGSWNAGSGAYISGAYAATVVGSGASYERHDILPPSEKDRAIDDVVKRLRVRQEVGIPSVDGDTTYTLDGAASPNLIEDIFDVYYFSDPTGSLDRQQHAFDEWRVVQTATGNELRVSPALGGSAQLVLDAILTLTLGSGDAATINIPDERWVLFGAEAQCWRLMEQRAPGQDVTQYATRRKQAAMEFSRLSSRYAVSIQRKIELDAPF